MSSRGPPTAIRLRMRFVTHWQRGDPKRKGFPNAAQCTARPRQWLASQGSGQWVRAHQQQKWKPWPSGPAAQYVVSSEYWRTSTRLTYSLCHRHAAHRPIRHALFLTITGRIFQRKPGISLWSVSKSPRFFPRHPHHFRSSSTHQNRRPRARFPPKHHPRTRMALSANKWYAD
jgi:hypothetical protein